jgi:hypothetical protein
MTLVHTGKKRMLEFKLLATGFGTEPECIRFFVQRASLSAMCVMNRMSSTTVSLYILYVVSSSLAFPLW